MIIKRLKKIITGLILPLIFSCVFLAANEKITPLTQKNTVSVRLLFGVKEHKAASWQGNYRLKKGKITAAHSWRLIEKDFATLTDFKLKIRRACPLKWEYQAPGSRPVSSLPYLPNGFILAAEEITVDSQILIKIKKDGKTVPGFQIPLGKLPFGKRLAFLNGDMIVDRVPTSRLITSSPTEDAYPSAAAAPGGGAVAAYIAFTGNKRFQPFLKRLPEEPQDFSYLQAPTGGDRVMFSELKNGEWSQPIPLTGAGGDIFRTAAAVDGDGRAWVSWSENTGGNWDIYARMRTGKKWAQPIRVTTDPGADINHVTATGPDGRIWLVWQGFRGNNSDIFAARQQGAGFGEAVRIASGPANEWTPALAVSPQGHVTAAWDSYEKGDYDILLRTYFKGAWGKVITAAASQRGELRPAIIYDKRSRLWIAYESAPQGWGKDYGFYDKAFPPLYSERRIGLKVLVKDKFYTPPGDINHIMPRTNLTLYWGRLKEPVSLLSGPKLALDAQGRVWLSARARLDRFVSSRVGSTWLNFLTTCDSSGWRQAAPIPRTDGMMHESPVLLPAPAPNGGLRIISSSDNRLRNAAFYRPLVEQKPGQNQNLPPAATRNRVHYADVPVNWNIYSIYTGPAKAPGEIELSPLAGNGSRHISPADRKEAGAVTAIRNYRAEIGGKRLRILRGEFHRHSEISSDGGADGSLFDMWRYGLDIAALDWLGSGDHFNGKGREYTWWLTQKTCDVFHNQGAFMPMFSYERSVIYPYGHRNILFAQRGIRNLNILYRYEPDTEMLYKYLRFFGGICSVHTSATRMGTDWRSNDPEVEPVVEIFQGTRQSYEKENAPRVGSAFFTRGGWRPKGMVHRALQKGYRLGFQASSDHKSTHISYCCVFVEESSRQAILQALKKRRVYAATDNIIADVRCGSHFMGEEFTVDRPPTLDVKLTGTAPFVRVTVVKDGIDVYTLKPGKTFVQFSWTDTAAQPGILSYYYVRGEQVGKEIKRKIKLPDGKLSEVTYSDGEMVWVSPMWITSK
ncbi:MAG: hypothetical protein KAW12_14080 [Candidatus Aminicenantes bacterium]|nr:hypothetical protein [Candidatus Aminicenantes bacterium]